MAWYSLLPPQLTLFETWAVRIFIFLGLITIVPWAVLIVFDAGFYLYRMVLWEFPWIGGRARGQQRPRAPSLQERPDGQRRAFGLRGVETDAGDSDQGKKSDMSEHQAAERGRDAEKENIAPAVDGRAHADTDGDVKRRRLGRA
ncbi:uncharacterized protein N7482_003568 [Penicillium canariense]|uniref:Uncharacterized protein n=1 Tax=Penicillium canariense TaxID=189055 RepID=A0A9W9I793_9EURO|nr:uncharacterized protein N7482_003568 [Penicillium canariense]KAJ5167974.1 hypothetical protein N7482_003568 [Penicillium canariense]